jgi:hypothetical protein
MLKPSVAETAGGKAAIGRKTRSTPHARFGL